MKYVFVGDIHGKFEIMEVKCGLTGKSHSCEVPSCDNQFTIVSFGKVKEKK